MSKVVKGNNSANMESSAGNESPLQLNIGLLDLGELVREVAVGVRALSEDHNITLEGLSGAEIQGDRERLADVLNNLIIVALSYSNTGPISLNLELIEDGLVVEVINQAAQISSDEQTRLFGLFHGIHTNHPTDGSLGAYLYSSREVVEAHGGKIWIRTNEAKAGASFFFSLPFQDMNTPPAEFGDDPTPYSLPAALFISKENQRPYALVAGDDREAVALLSVTLTGAGWQVENARTGIEALHKIVEHTPDVLLLDSLLPVLNGRETINRLRGLEGLKPGQPLNLPTILMVSTPESVENSKELGIAGCLVKPFEPDEVLRLVDEKKPKNNRSTH